MLCLLQTRQLNEGCGQWEAHSFWSRAGGDGTALLYKVLFSAAQIQVCEHLLPFCGHFYYTGHLSRTDSFPNSSVLFYTISTSSLIYFWWWFSTVADFHVLDWQCKEQAQNNNWILIDQTVMVVLVAQLSWTGLYGFVLYFPSLCGTCVSERMGTGRGPEVCGSEPMLQVWVITILVCHQLNFPSSLKTPFLASREQALCT